MEQKRWQCRSLVIAVWAAAELVSLGLVAQTADEVVEVIEVQVPVQVLVRGQPVRGLNRDDFVLRARGKRREIVGFREIDLRSMETAEGVPLSGRRHFVLLFDLAFAQPASILRAQQAALRVLSDDLLPSDIVSVGSLSMGRGLQILLGFTPDHEQARRAVAALGSGAVLEAAADPLGLTIAGEWPLPLTSGPIMERGEQAVDPAALEQAVVEAQLRGGYDVLIRSMHRLAELLQGVDGAKHVVYLSAGASSRVLFGTGVQSEEERQRIIQENEAAISGNTWEAGIGGRFGDTSLLVNFEKMLKEFVRAGSTIEAIDIGGLRAEAAGLSSGDDTLFFMAETTGGSHIRNHNDFDLAMNKILARTSVTYVLSFQVPPSRRAGQFEKIDVRLAEKGRGVEVLHRPGYHTPRPYAELPPEARRAQSARWLLGDDERNEIEIALRIEPITSAERRKAFSVAVEIDASSIRAVSGGTAPAATEVYAYVFSPSGRIVAAFDERLEPPDPGVARLGSEFPLVLEPGTYDLRVLVREMESGAASTRVVQLEVPE